jgi:predicted RNA polymerase sigma factor
LVPWSACPCSSVGVGENLSVDRRLQEILGSVSIRGGPGVVSTKETEAMDTMLDSIRTASPASPTATTAPRRAPSEFDEIEARMTESVGDGVLRLIFTACHPVRSTDARVALTLRLIGGLTTEEIARAFLTVEPTIAQRIVRAKRPRAGLALLDQLRREPSLARYHLLPSARADLLERLGRRAEACREFKRAAELAGNARQRARLLARAAACETTDDSA